MTKPNTVAMVATTRLVGVPLDVHLLILRGQEETSRRERADCEARLALLEALQEAVEADLEAADGGSLADHVDYQPDRFAAAATEHVVEIRLRDLCPIRLLYRRATSETGAVWYQANWTEGTTAHSYAVLPYSGAPRSLWQFAPTLPQALWLAFHLVGVRLATEATAVRSSPTPAAQQQSSRAKDEPQDNAAVAIDELRETVEDVIAGVFEAIGHPRRHDELRDRHTVEAQLAG